MTKEFICPHCSKPIEKSLISRFFASIGGAKSKRTWTPDQKKAHSEKMRNRVAK